MNVSHFPQVIILMAIALALSGCNPTQFELDPEKTTLPEVVSPFQVKIDKTSIPNSRVDISEGSAVVVILSMSPAREVATQLSVGLSAAVPASVSQRFQAFSATATIPAGQTTTNIALNSVNDAIYQGADEDFTLSISDATSAVSVTDGSLTIRLTDNEAVPSIAINDVTVAENAGTMTFTITQNSVSRLDTTFSYAASNGTATGAGVDFALVAGSATIPAGSTSTTLNVTLTNDSIDEANETFTVVLSSPTNATISDASGTGTINDDDSTPAIVINDVTAAESAGTMTFVISLSNASSQNITVDYAASGGTATGGGTDYSLTSGTATITAGTTTANVVVTINDDAIDEADETFYLNLSNPTAATISDNQAMGTITDDDGTPSLSINDVTAAENAGTLVFTVTLSGVSSQNVTVDYAASGGTATSGGLDYTLAAGTATITAGNTTTTITVNISDDALYEISETFNVGLTNSTNATVSDGTGVGTITDNDAAPTLVFSAASQTVAETAGTATLTVNLSAAAGVAMTVDYAVSGGTAILTTHYALTNGSLTFNPGDTSKTITINVVNDTLFYGNRTVTVAISNPVGGATLGGTTSHTVTITDDDATKLLLTGSTPVMSLICGGPFDVVVADASDNPVNVGAHWTVNFSGIGNGAFYSDAGCTSSITSTQITAGTSAKQVYFKGVKPETLTLAASATDLSSANLGLLTKGVIKAALGDMHSCALYNDKTVKCWGFNRLGQVGDGTNINVLAPTVVSGITDAVDIAASNRSSCALLSTGIIKCWGHNSSGMIGDGTTTTRLTPVSVSGITTAVKISAHASGDHVCALLANGTAQCWGANSSGQLGDGSQTTRTSPVAVTGLSNILTIATGCQTSCALLSDGTVKCWGVNGSGGIGDGSTTTRLTATAVSGVSTASKLFYSYQNGYVVLNDGSVMAWGTNGYGMLGDGTSVNRTTPVSVAALNNVSSISGGADFNCGVMSDKTVKCWGANTKGQQSGFGSSAATPTTVAGLSDVDSVSAGVGFACAVLVSGYVKCWGTNTLGQLGGGSYTAALSPVDIDLTNISSMSFGVFHACAILTDGTGKCWGTNQALQLGTNTSAAQVSPTAVSGLSLATTISSGTLSNCSLASDGSVKCWGYNAVGVFGDGTTTSRNLAHTVTAAAGATAVAQGNALSCYIFSGTVKCAGNNFYGLGDGSTSNSSSLVTVSGITTATQIAVSTYTGCALLGDSTIKCWGRGVSGELGNGASVDSMSPVTVSGISNATSVVAGAYHFCAGLSDNTVKCWGSNGVGTLGDNSYTNRNSPVTVTGLTNVSSLVAGQYHNCALLSDTTVKCWGRGIHGQMGDGIGADRLTATTVPGLTSVLSLHAGMSSNTTCARFAGNVAKCWGNNDNAQIAGSPPSFSIVDVLGL